MTDPSSESGRTNGGGEPSVPANERGCYCSLWDKEPAALAAQGLPRGFCGRCDTCGEPGHVRHFPGTSPVTGAWCDRHYRRLAVLHPLGHTGRRLYLVLFILIVVAIGVLRA